MEQTLMKTTEAFTPIIKAIIIYNHNIEMSETSSWIDTFVRFFSLPKSVGGFWASVLGGVTLLGASTYYFATKYRTQEP